MAENATRAAERDRPEGGTMDLAEHVKTWLGFWTGVKWTVLGLVVLGILLAIFRTNS